MNNNNDNSNTVEPFKVYVRIRPFLDRELTQLNQLYSEDPNNNKNLVKSILTVENNTLYLNDPYNGELYGKNVKAFPFDSIFTEKDDNKSIFNKIIKKLVDNILNGFNSTALAYGVTGTGKTHTMFGDIYHSDNNEKGISMYAVDYLFNRINKETEKSFITKMSYLEIYNEQAIDLLTENPSNEGIMIVEDPNKGVIVPELTQIVVNKSSEVLNYIVIGNQRRTMGPTGVNQFSSRSHAILEISIEQRVNNKSKEEVMNIMKSTFKPEFLNRIDDIVFFKGLTLPDLSKIVAFKVTDFVADPSFWSVTTALVVPSVPSDEARFGVVTCVPYRET